jgi:hypothetical protein
VHVVLGALLEVQAARETAPGDRPGQTGEHRDVGPADEVEHTQRVVGGHVQRGVAVDGGDADQVQIRVQRGEHDGDRVVGAGVHVQDHLASHALSLPWAALCTAYTDCSLKTQGTG